MKAFSNINRVISNISGVMLAVMTTFVLLQILFRYVLKSPLSYSEELARFSMIWTVMLGSTVAFRNKTHIVVDYFVEKLPKKIFNPIKLLQKILVFTFCMILVVEGYSLAVQAMSQLATASKIPVGLIVISIPISGTIIVLYILEDIVKKLSLLKQNNEINNT